MSTPKEKKFSIYCESYDGTRGDSCTVSTYSNDLIVKPMTIRFSDDEYPSEYLICYFLDHYWLIKPMAASITDLGDDLEEESLIEIIYNSSIGDDIEPERIECMAKAIMKVMSPGEYYVPNDQDGIIQDQFDPYLQI